MIKDTSAQDITLATGGGRRKRIALTAIAALAGLVLAGSALATWLRAEVSVDSARLRLAEVRAGDLVRDVSVNGRVVAGFSPALYAPVAGTVSFAVRAGDYVEQDQVLAQIDSPQLANELAQEKARLQRLDIDVKRQAIQNRMNDLTARKDLAQAEVALNAAKREYQRNQQAWDKGAINEVDLLRAKDEWSSAQIAFDHAGEETTLNRSAWEFEQRTRELELEQQRLLVAELERVYGRLQVRAPIAGMVGSLLVADKTSVADNTALLNVVDLSQLEVEADVPEIYADTLGPGMAAVVRVGTDELPGTVTAISPEIVAGQVAARIRFDGELPQGLRQNQRLRTRLLLDEHRDTLMVTRGPFVDEGAGRIAYVVEDDYARRVQITTGLTSVSDVEVLDGLAPGDTIVISSMAQFRNAERVRLR
ncbi:efflux RND transporter periplasmic adaptor subunit [Mangrovimicrobium sediminis]|uniref:efflux RND transporter periplasmic adaptor subunit n=1 Tax=Mangrovimicrobium sediminis TaxID=2562682 RepID=UPI001436B600|nr:HlyD family efflux transporter periplasmic adaptor subunit [Haliea sp. SAOS-164]